MRAEFLCLSVLRVASGPRVKLASCQGALNPSVVYSTVRSLLLCGLFYEAICFYILPCVNLYWCFSVLLACDYLAWGRES